MLPAEHRLRRPADFSAAVRSGARSGRRHVVLHVRDRAAAGPAGPRPGSLVGVPGVIVSPGPRVGLVVSKSVGSAVVRHAVSRRLRHVLAPVVALLPPGTDVVVRALAPAAGASSAELDTDVRSALRRLGLLDGAR